MALRDQPYLPLYVQDFLTDEKLNECSASSHGVYIKIMCLMHKSKYYGKIYLRVLPQQNDRQTESICRNFADQLVKHLPFSVEIIETALMELLREEVLTLDGHYLIQKRMVLDNSLSIIRSAAGKNGAKKTNGSFAAAKRSAKLQQVAAAKDPANTEYEIDLSKCLNMKRIVKVNVRGLGEFETSIFDVGDPKDITQLERFLTNSQTEFEVIAMTKPFMKNISNFRIALQAFVTGIQEKGTYQHKGKLNEHFGNWLNSQNGSLQRLVDAEKQKVSVQELEQVRVDQDEYLNYGR